MASISTHTRTAQFSKAVFIQAVAPYEAVVVEVVYPAIELMLACAIILGSSGGAWLGLTLGSMFPQRVAAGLFVSSYGQKLSRTQIIIQEKPHAWRPAGTVWTEGPEPYLVPATGLSDTWKNAIGYVLQYAMLAIGQSFRLPIRDALEFVLYPQPPGAFHLFVAVALFPSS